MCQFEDLTVSKKSFPINRVDFLYDNELDSDVVFLVGIEPEVWRIPGHKNILSKANSVFRALLEGPLATRDRTIVIEDVESRAFDYLLRYLYGKEIIFQSPSTTLSTLYAAHKYLCPGLIELCVKYLDENLNARNVLEIFSHARLYAVRKPLNGFEPSAPLISSDANGLLTPTHCFSNSTIFNNNNNINIINNENSIKDLRKGDCHESSIPFWSEVLVENCLQYIDENADEVLNQENLEDMSVDDLKEIIQRGTLRIKSEYTVFLALHRWTNRECKRQKLNLDAKNRRQVLGDLIYEIRFPFLKPEEFISEPIQSGLLDLQELAVFSAFISNSKNIPSIPQKWKCHMEKICRSRIYTENGIYNSSQRTYLIESEKNKDLRRTYFTFKKMKNSKSKSTTGKSNKSCKTTVNENDKSCCKCFPDCLIDVLVCLFD